MSGSGRRSGHAAAGLWWAAGALTFWSCGYAIRRADDLWWHVAAGRRMLATGTLGLRDEFSFTAAGAPWLNDAWLADLFFGVWERTFGLYALAWWKWGLVVATFLVLFATARRLAAEVSDAAHLAAYAAATLGALTAAPFLDLRPQLYTFLGVVLVLWGTIARPAPTAALPLLFVVWANLHAGFIFGLASLGVLLVPPVLRGGPERRRALVTGGLSLAACLVNPHGPIALTRPLRYAFDASSPFHDLAEWWPPFRAGGVESPLYPYAIGVFAVAAVLAVALPATRRQASTWTGLVLAGATLAMSLTSRRFIPLFAITQALVLAPVLGVLLAPLARRVPDSLVALGALALGVFWLAPYPRASYAFHYLAAEDHFPVDTADFIEANTLAGNVFAQYAYAGYVLMRTDGRLKVFVDGRADAVYPDEVFARYRRASQGKDDWLEVIESSGADYVLWPRQLPSGGLPQAMVRTGRWRQVHQDAVSVLLARNEVADATAYRPAPDSAYRDYALGLLAIDRNDLAEARTRLTAALARAPYLRRACNGLAFTELQSGDPDAGWQTLARCEAFFPDPERALWFHEQVRLKQRGAAG
jgi:hypothetical protein